MNSLHRARCKSRLILLERDWSSARIQNLSNLIEEKQISAANREMLSPVLPAPVHPLPIYLSFATMLEFFQPSTRARVVSRDFRGIRHVASFSLSSLKGSPAVGKTGQARNISARSLSSKHRHSSNGEWRFLLLPCSPPLSRRVTSLDAELTKGKRIARVAHSRYVQHL